MYKIKIIIIYNKLEVPSIDYKYKTKSTLKYNMYCDQFLHAINGY